MGIHVLLPAGAEECKHSRWYRPGPPFVPVKMLDVIRKVMGFVPLTMWGRFGSPVPHKVDASL